MSNIIAAFVVGLIVVFIFGAIQGVVIMWLWNGMLVDLFHFPMITWMQGWGLSILGHMLFVGPSISSNNG